MNTIEAAKRYISRGLVVIPVPPGEKNPARLGWQNERWGIEDVEKVWGKNQNIGVVLGKASGNLVNIDNDWPEAVVAARHILPRTLTSGRESCPDAHYWFLVEPLPKTHKLQLSGTKGERERLVGSEDERIVVVEVRSTGSQTLVAPSLHPDGDRYIWSGREDREIASVGREELEEAVLDVATAALLARNWPGVGARHEFTLAAAGFLGRRLSARRVRRIMKGAIAASGDEEVGGRLRNVEDTLEKLEREEPTTGGPELDNLVPGLTHQLWRWHRWNKGSHESGVIHSTNGKGTPVNKRNIFLTPREILAEASTEEPWACPPWLALGGVTDVAGAAKLAGKTTLSMSMAEAMMHGGYFMGRRCIKTPVVYLTEQGNNFAKALRDAGIDGDIHSFNRRGAKEKTKKETEELYIMPRRLTLDMKWPQIVDVAVEKCLDVGAKVLMVDTLPRFAGLEGDKENNAGDVMKAMTPLLNAAQVHGLAVWCIRHANHEGRGRGSTMFLHDVDIVITIRLPDATLPSNVRIVEAVGRYDGIPPRTNIQFKEGRYYDLGADAKVQRNRARDAVKDLLSSGKSIPRPELVDRAAKNASTSASTVGTAINELVDEGVIVQLDKGSKGHPYRYTFPENLSEAKENRKAEASNAPVVEEF